ncbi:bacteriocin immunity protein [Clostridium tetani]|uniref:bacteriocin immunity protein n=1 Tax=Clostridium tetani TaxID=1513 RepID=UPI00100BC999|nr:bacteriocin immunity protein [Clostridium tetani]RXM56854.1 hypothetical protein DP133_12575 [Clostridium tetani]RXM76237.1 hypothetical protein DP154_08125 [Clostridium tetani]RYU98899.1 hypothetical protein DP144_08130 [Clostridium tetani]BDR76721.1 hypothetical protein K154306013_23810 [Clostridium tetani]
MDRKLRKEELIELVEKICNVCGNEEQLDNWIEIIEKEIGCPEVSDYIYWEEENLLPKEIVEKALSYKPILL